MDVIACEIAIHVVTRARSVSRNRCVVDCVVAHSLSFAVLMSAEWALDPVKPIR